jgi:hypothetical protein
MSEDEIVSFRSYGPHQSYVYVNAVDASFYVREDDRGSNVVFVFDDGFITVDGKSTMLNKRDTEGVVSWFSEREPTRVEHISAPPGRVRSENSTVKFVNKFKTMGFLMNLSKDVTFVGDSDIFVCGELKGTIFSCLHQLFSEQITSAKFVQYYEDSPATSRLR